MLKIDVDKKKEEMLIGFGGSMPEILTELGSVIHVIHIRLCRQSLFSGLDFEAAIRDPKFWDFFFKPQEYDSEILETEGSKEK